MLDFFYSIGLKSKIFVSHVHLVVKRTKNNLKYKSCI